MTTGVYEPSKTLSAKLVRRWTRLRARRILPFSVERPIVSLTFDDCPITAVSQGVRQMEKENWQATVYIACGLFGIKNHHGKMVSGSDVKALYAAGHEIADHTFSHIDATQHTPEAFMKDVRRNQDKLDSLGIPASQGFAYPYGEVTPSVKSALGSDFDGLRGIQPGAHFDKVDLHQIKSTPLFSSRNIQTVVAEIDNLKNRPGWLTLFTHDIRDNPSPWGCTPKDMANIITAIKDCGAQVMTVADAINHLKGQRL